MVVLVEDCESDFAETPAIDEFTDDEPADAAPETERDPSETSEPDIAAAEADAVIEFAFVPFALEANEPVARVLSPESTGLGPEVESWVDETRSSGLARLLANEACELSDLPEPLFLSPSRSESPL